MTAGVLSRVAAGCFALMLTACVSPPRRVAEADGTYCVRIGKTNRLWRTCTTTPVPSDAMEADAKRFEARDGVGTLYVVRRQWADSAYKVPIEIDGTNRIDTIPASFVRLRLKPGSHTLSLTWDGKTEFATVMSRAGEIAFLEIEGSAWIGATSYRWQTRDDGVSRGRAARSKLIADLDLAP